MIWDYEEELRELDYRQLLEMAKEFSIRSTVFSDFMPYWGQGPFLMDAENIVYIDFTSGIGCNNLGYAHPKISQALIKQISRGILNFPHNDWYNPWAVVLSKKLCEITPGKFPKKVFFSNSGTEAVEAGIKICLKYNLDRKKFFSFKNAFHGRTGYSLALNSSKPIHKKDFPNALGDNNVHYLPFPEQNTALASFDWVYYFKENEIDLRTFNAINIELVQGEGGINVADRQNITNLVQLLRQNGVIIIVDEVQTGMMRTGKMFACEHYGIEPDIICLGKGLGSGMAIGATIAKAEYDFPENGCHSGTFGGNQMVAVAAMETIKVMESFDRQALMESVKILSKFSDSGLGMMQRIECENPIQRDKIMAKALENRLILLPAGLKSIRLMPPLIIEKEVLLKALDIIAECRKN